MQTDSTAPRNVAVQPKAWLNPITIIDFKKAVKAKEPTFEIDGKKFSLEYFSRFEDGKNVQYLRYTRSDGGFVPMGTIRIKDLMEMDAL